MPSHTIAFHLDAPPERVFDYIADIRNEAEWSKDITSVALVGDGPRIAMHFAMDLAPEGDGTNVTMTVDMRLHGAWRPLAPMLKLGMPREMAKRPKQFGAALAAR
jgi:hypothetical protein